jgi:hypothetical protein
MGNTGGDESAGSSEKKYGIGAASGAVTRNASASGARVETVLQVPPLVRNREQTTYVSMRMGMGMGGHSGAVEKATRAHRRRTKILFVVPFG